MEFCRRDQSHEQCCTFQSYMYTTLHFILTERSLTTASFGPARNKVKSHHHHISNRISEKKKRPSHESRHIDSPCPERANLKKLEQRECVLFDSVNHRSRQKKTTVRIGSRGVTDSAENFWPKPQCSNLSPKSSGCLLLHQQCFQHLSVDPGATHALRSFRKHAVCKRQ